MVRKSGRTILSRLDRCEVAIFGLYRVFLQLQISNNMFDRVIVSICYYS